MTRRSDLDDDTKFQLLNCTINEVLPEVPHQLRECCIMAGDCVDGRVPCLKACCIWLCDECLLIMLKSNHSGFKCPTCGKESLVESILTHEAVACEAASYRAKAELLKNIDVQICRCGTLMVNETMYPQQKCYVCKRVFCFFCNEDWNDAKMNADERFGCSAECSITRKVNFEFTPFAYDRPRDKIPKRRACPRCSAYVGYGGCPDKYHYCIWCGHMFCFWCLLPKSDCPTSYNRLDCTSDGKPTTQTVDALPRLVSKPLLAE